MPGFDEPKMTINGHPLSNAQAMTVRVALESFASDLSHNGLGDDEHGKTMTKLYIERVKEMRKLMGY